MQSLNKSLVAEMEKTLGRPLTSSERNLIELAEKLMKQSEPQSDENSQAASAV